MGKTAPEAPDPEETAQAQSKWNVTTAEKTKDINAHDTFGPNGSVTWQRDENGRPISQTTSLNPESQKAFDANQVLRTNLATKATELSNQLPTEKFTLDGLPEAGGNVSVKNTDHIADAQYNRFMSLAQPQFDKQNNDNNVMLSDRGIPLGSEISDGERNRVATGQNEATSRAGWDAILSAGQEQSRQFGLDMGVEQRQDQIRGNALSDRLLERSQPFNELSSYVSGQPLINTPQGSNAGNVNIGSPDYQGLVQNKYTADLEAHNKAQQDFWGGLLGGASLFL